MNKTEHAENKFNNGFNCAQSVLSAFSAGYGLDDLKALRISAGFGGGMGRTAGTCGAVTGAIMVIGLEYGAIRGDDKVSKEKTHQVVRLYMEEFKKRNKTLICKELLNCDISTDEGHKEALEKGLIKTLCVKFVKDSVEILEGILKEKT